MTYPVNVSIAYGDGNRSRGLAVAGIIFPVKVLLAIPHLVALAFVQFGAMIATWIGYWGIAINGSLSPGIARFVHNALDGTYGYLPGLPACRMSTRHLPWSSRSTPPRW